MTFSRLKLSLNYPHPMQFVTNMFWVQKLRPQKMIEFQIRACCCIGVIRNINFLFPNKLPVISIRSSVKQKHIIGNSHSLRRHHWGSIRIGRIRRRNYSLGGRVPHKTKPGLLNLINCICSRKGLAFCQWWIAPFGSPDKVSIVQFRGRIIRLMVKC